MSSQLHITFSNRVEELFERLKEQLYHARQSPFEEILLIVPSPAMKSWLTLELAKDPAIQLAFGFKVAYLNEAIERLQLKNDMPGRLELAFVIEKEMQELLDSGSPHAAALAIACNANNARLSAIKRARLAEELADLFRNYAEYAPIEMAEWSACEAKDWQQKLWQQVFPAGAFQGRMRLASKTPPAQVHLFAISFLSQMKQDFFAELAQKTHVQQWILSPSRMFWTDIKTDRERVRHLAALEKRKTSPTQIAEWEDFLEEGNPLLANDGRLGREWMKRLEELPHLAEDAFVLPPEIALHPAYADLFLEGVEIAPENRPVNLLTALQADLTLMRVAEKNEKVALTEDDGIEVHAAPSIKREVEVLYQNLLRLMDKSKQDGRPIQPNEVLVMVPDLEKYVPFIKQVFQNPDSLLDAALIELAVASESSYIQTFMQLIEIGQSRWERDRVFKLLESDFIQRKVQFSKEERSELQRILEREGVHWGESPAHRQKVLAEEGFSGALLDTGMSGTWAHGFQTALLSLGQSHKAEEYFKNGFQGQRAKTPLSFTQAETVGKGMQLIALLRTALKPIAEQAELPLCEWSLYLTGLAESYLDGETDEDSVHQALELKKILQRLAGVRTEGRLFSWNSVAVHLKAELQSRRTSLADKNLQAVRFCASLPMRAVPARLIAWLGLGDQVMPRQERKSSLNQFKFFKNRHYLPSPADLDRYLFLESLLSARDCWICSYTLHDGAQAAGEPSVLISELLDYLDEAFEVNETLPSKAISHRHPEFGFDASYFQPGSRMINYSESDYAAAEAYALRPVNAKNNPFRAPLKVEELALHELQTSFSIDELKRFFRNPIEQYLKKNLSLRFDKRDDRHPTMEEFEEDDWLFEDLLRWTFRYPADQVIAFAEKCGKLPVEPFKALAKRRLKERFEEVHDVLSGAGIQPKDLFEVEFSHDCKERNLRRGRLVVPAPPIEIGGKTVRVTGVLPYVTKQGMLYFKENKPESKFSAVPESMLHQMLPEELSQPVGYYVKDKIKAVPHAIKSSAEAWKKLFEHLKRAETQPVPFLPTWIKPILEGSSEKLMKQMNVSQEDEYLEKEDPYLRWMLSQQGVGNIDHAAIIADWRPLAVQLFGENDAIV